MSLTFLCDKFGKTDNDCTKIGSANDFMTVIFPIIDISLKDQSFRSFLIAVSFSAIFSSKKLCFCKSYFIPRSLNLLRKFHFNAFVV